MRTDSVEEVCALAEVVLHSRRQFVILKPSHLIMQMCVVRELVVQYLAHERLRRGASHGQSATTVAVVILRRLEPVATSYSTKRLQIL